MIEKLRKFILEEYAFKQRQIDDNFYHGIAEIIRKEKGLVGVLRNIQFITNENESKDGAPGQYHCFSKTITINKPKVEREILDVEKVLSRRITLIEKPIFKYLYAAHVIVHEMMHVCQESELRRIGRRDEKGIVSKLDVRCMENEAYMYLNLGRAEAIKRIKKWQEFLKKQYQFDVLNERDAEIKSFSLIYTLLKKYQTLYPNLVEYERAELYESIAMGYREANGNVVSPAYQYAHILLSNKMIPEKNAKWYDRDMKKSLENVRKMYSSTSDRLKHGLPVSAEEYKTFCDERLKMGKMGYIVHSYGKLENQDVSPQSPIDR